MNSQINNNNTIYNLKELAMSLVTDTQPLTDGCDEMPLTSVGNHHPVSDAQMREIEDELERDLEELANMQSPSDTGAKKNLIKKNLIVPDQNIARKHSKQKQGKKMTTKRNQCAAACWAQNVEGCFTRCKAQVMDGNYIDAMEEEVPHKFCKTHNKVIDKIVSRAHFGHFFVHQKWEINGEFGKEWSCVPCIKTPLNNGNVANGGFQLCDDEEVHISQISSDLPLDFRPWINVTVLSDEMKDLEDENKKIVKDYMKEWRQQRKPCVILSEEELADIASEPEVPELPPPSPPVVGEAIPIPQEVQAVPIPEPLQAEPVEAPPPVPQSQGETKEEEPVVKPKKERKKFKIRIPKRNKPVNNPEE